MLFCGMKMNDMNNTYERKNLGESWEKTSRDM